MLPLLIAAATALPMQGWPVSAADLARYWAPVLVQHTHRDGSNRTQDLPVAFDFDGDWDMRNNWKNQPSATRAAQPVVYYAAVASERRAYVTYYLYYPRDWSYVCLPMLCHENDLEQFTLVVENDGALFGHLAAMDVKYHLGYRAYPVDFGGAAPREPTRARMWRSEQGRPVVRVEWGGHGVVACDLDGDGQRDGDCNPKDGAAQLLPDGAQPVAMRGPIPQRTYLLESLHDTLWPHRAVASGTWQTDALHYQGARLGRLGAALGVSFAGSGMGGGARAPWGVRGSGTIAAGERFFDPALAFDTRWRFADGPDTSPYVEHPYLDDLRRDGVSASTTTGLARPTP